MQFIKKISNLQKLNLKIILCTPEKKKDNARKNRALS